MLLMGHRPFIRLRDAVDRLDFREMALLEKSRVDDYVRNGRQSQLEVGHYYHPRLKFGIFVGTNRWSYRKLISNVDP